MHHCHTLHGCWKVLPVDVYVTEVLFPFEFELSSSGFSHLGLLFTLYPLRAGRMAHDVIILHIYYIKYIIVCYINYNASCHRHRFWPCSWCSDFLPQIMALLMMSQTSIKINGSTHNHSVFSCDFQMSIFELNKQNHRLAQNQLLLLLWVFLLVCLFVYSYFYGTLFHLGWKLALNAQQTS